ncbi:MAG: hypothetical protein IKW18_04500 [Clostridia bacterium]|nr:hypothetical protein [Clostridia bacterium]
MVIIMENVSKQMNLAPWEQGFCWYWCNDNEIFFYTEEDFERHVKKLAESGITVIMTFSLTHFRMAYYPYWEEINRSLEKLVRVAHKWGIRVVEHHSASLASWVLAENGWEKLEREFYARSKGTAKYDNWKKIFKFLTYDYRIDGIDFRTFMQIDGSTGEHAKNRYGTYSACYNNPDYRRIYFNYMKSVIATGIDGIMNDDVQFFGEENACTCEHCRKLFKEQTGYELPSPENWSTFFNNYDDPAYIAWKKFKFDSTERFYRDIGAFYESLGVKLMRPNYSSCVLKQCPTAYPFDLCTDLWDFIFQENCNADIMKQSYMDFMVEAVHRYAAGQRRGVPTMSMFYPDRPDSVYFAWSLARSWGQLYTGTSHGEDITPMELPYRIFEKKYMRFYTAPEKISDITFYFSRRTRDFTERTFKRFMQHMIGSMQAAYASGFCLDMVMEEDSLEELLRHKTIVLSYAAMLTPSEIERFTAYVKAGGKLIILGDFAIYDEDGRKRSEEEINGIFGTDMAWDTATKLGKGEIFRMSFRPEISEYQGPLGCPRQVVTPVFKTAIPSKWEMQKNGTGRVLRDIQTPNVEIQSENDRLVVTTYEVKDARIMHIVNLADTISLEPITVSHDDLIPNFCANAPKLGAITLTVKNPPEFCVNKVYLATPEKEEPIPLSMKTENDIASLEIPANIFSAYAMVIMEK